METKDTFNTFDCSLIRLKTASVGRLPSRMWTTSVGRFSLLMIYRKPRSLPATVRSVSFPVKRTVQK